MLRARQKFLDDIAAMAGGTVNVLSGTARQVKDDIKAKIDDKILSLDLVPRSEFERLEASLQKSRIEQEELQARVEKLEKLLQDAAKQ